MASKVPIYKKSLERNLLCGDTYKTDWLDRLPKFFNIEEEMFLDYFYHSENPPQALAASLSQ